MSHIRDKQPDQPTLVFLAAKLQKGVILFLAGLVTAFLGGMQLIHAFNATGASWLLIAIALLISACLLLAGIMRLFEQVIVYVEATSKSPLRRDED